MRAPVQQIHPQIRAWRTLLSRAPGLGDVCDQSEHLCVTSPIGSACANMWGWGLFDHLSRAPGIFIGASGVPYRGRLSGLPTHPM